MENKQPVVIVIRDYDGFFEDKIRTAIKLRKESFTVETIEINSGPYRPYEMAHKRSGDKISFDFYAASRNPMFDENSYTLQDIADLL